MHAYPLDADGLVDQGKIGRRYRLVLADGDRPSPYVWGADRESCSKVNSIGITLSLKSGRRVASDCGRRGKANWHWMAVHRRDTDNSVGSNAVVAEKSAGSRLTFGTNASLQHPVTTYHPNVEHNRMAPELESSERPSRVSRGWVAENRRLHGRQHLFALAEGGEKKSWNSAPS